MTLQGSSLERDVVVHDVVARRRCRCAGRARRGRRGPARHLGIRTGGYRRRRRLLRIHAVQCRLERDFDRIDARLADTVGLDGLGDDVQQIVVSGSRWSRRGSAWRCSTP